MRHLYRSLFLLLAYFFFNPAAKSCSCFWIETFCDYVQENPAVEFSPTIVRGEILEFYDYPLDTLTDGWVWRAPLVDVLVTELIYGEAIGVDTFTFYGQDGLNCAASFQGLSGGTEFVFFVPGVDPSGIYYWHQSLPQVTDHPLSELLGCGPSFLSISNNGQVLGPLYPGVNEMELNEFRDEITNCVGFTSTEEPDLLMELQIFPNPATDELRVRHAPAEVQNIQLLDLHGRQIKEISTSAGLTTEHQLVVSELPAGVYLLSISSDGQRVTRRVVKR